MGLIFGLDKSSKPKYNIPKEGERVLANYQEEWLVLEIGYETPTYEENFEPFYYWFEPFSDMSEFESLDEITEWILLDDIVKGQIECQKVIQK